MTYDIEEIRKAGMSQDDLKAAFTSKKKDKKLIELIERHAWRVDDGVRRNLCDAKQFWAVDQAFNVSQDQITQTLVRGLLDKNPSKDDVLKLARDFGLEKMLTPLVDARGRRIGADGLVMTTNSKETPTMKLNLPVFITIFIPLVASYLKIRWAKLFGDRDVFPLYKYEPNRMATADEALCKVITARVQRQAVDMGNREDEKQSIFGMLQYGRCLNFPQESWYRESQKVKGKDKVVKEGIRWTRPHPTRIFWDQAHPLHTVNTDTGCQWYGYWTIWRYSEVKAQTDFWNKDSISIGVPGWRSDQVFKVYQELYPCVAKFPEFKPFKENDREASAFNYATSAADTGVDVVVIFDKVVPKDNGLGDYDQPIWMRFVYAGDRTCVYAEPLAYVPGCAYLYEAPENMRNVTSLALELVPFQDHMGNLLTQYLLSVKKNLTRVIAVNEDIITDGEWTNLCNSGENALRGWAPLFYSGKALERQRDQIQEAYKPIDMGVPQNTMEVINAVNSLVGILERVLGFSPQEVGAPASHETSATGDAITNANSSVRIGFTGSGISPAIAARKKAIYNAIIAYSDDQILAEVADLTDKGKKALEDAGFKLEDYGNSSYGVSGPKGNLDVEAFASEREGNSRINEARVAEMMNGFMTQVLPVLGGQLGVKWTLKAFNQIAEMYSLPLDFRLPEEGQEGVPTDAEQLKAMVEKMIADNMKPLAEGIQKNIGQPLQQVEQAVAQMGQGDQATQQAVQALIQKGQQLEQAVAAEGQAIQQLGAQQQQLAQGQQALGQGLAGLSQKVDQVATALMPQPAVAPQ